MEMILPQLCSPSVVWVPCIPDYENGKFVPVYNLNNIPVNLQEKVPNLPRGGLKSKPWSQNEDSNLCELVQKLGVKKWAKIATELNQVFNHDRKGKNCRERWNNHLDPDINKGQWSYEEDLVLLQKNREFGRRWSIIAKEFKGRTENSVKNRWNTLIKSSKATLGNAPSGVASDYLITHLAGMVEKKE